MKNLINTYREEEDIVTPLKTNMKWNVDKMNNVVNKWDDPWEKRHNRTKFWQFAKRINNMLEQSIGKPFDEVYAKVCNEFPSNIYCWGDSLKDYFNKQFTTHGWPRNRSHYYIDEDGLIQYYEEPYRRRKRPYLISYLDHPAEYRVNHDAIANNEPYMTEIFYICGREIYYRLLDSTIIPEKLFLEIQQKMPYDRRLYEIIERYVWKYEWRKGDPGYKQIKAEHEDLKKKEARERKKLQEEQRENLLKYLEYQRKTHEDDNIKRDSHGFDEESFKGEFYHGQKRKLKNKDI